MTRYDILRGLRRIRHLETTRDRRTRLHVAVWKGDGDIDIRRVAGIEHAQPGDLTFLANPKYHPHLLTTRASAVIVDERTPRDGVQAAILRSDHPALAFAHAIGFFVPVSSPAAGVEPLSSIASDATLGADVSIGPFGTIGSGASIGARTIVYPNVVIGAGALVGADCVIHAHVSVRDRARIGHRVILHDGVVVGSDGIRLRQAG